MEHKLLNTALLTPEEPKSVVQREYTPPRLDLITPPSIQGGPNLAFLEHTNYRSS